MKASTCILTFVLSFQIALQAVHGGTVSDSFASEDLIEMAGKQVKGYDVSKLRDVKLFAVYFSAHWCPPCRAFTPDLVQFYNRAKKNHPEFELIFVSSDRSAQDMENYMQSYGMKWPALKYGVRSELKKFGGNGIPNLVLLDENGTLITGSYEGAQYTPPRMILTELQKRLAENKAKAQQGSAVDPFKTKEVNVFSR